MVSVRTFFSASGSADTSIRSLALARMLVPPQAIHGLRPMANSGRPGTMRPTAWYDGDFTPASSQVFGRLMPRCGSLARMAAPVRVRLGAIARLLLPDLLNPARTSAIPPALYSPPPVAGIE